MHYDCINKKDVELCRVKSVDFRLNYTKPSNETPFIDGVKTLHENKWT